MEVRPGSWVYGQHGRYIGRVEAVSPTLLRVRGKTPYERVFYVPTSAIAGTLGDGRELVLNCPSEELAARGWLKPPHPKDGPPSLSLEVGRRPRRSQQPH